MTEDNVQAALKDTIESVVSKCWNCNFCFSVCPNYLSTRGFQTQGPSGITQSLLYAVRHDRFDDTVKKQLRSIVYACTLCNACVHACKEMSSAVSLTDAVAAGRELLVEKQIGPMPRQGKCLESIFKVANPYGKPPKKRLAWCREMNVPVLPRYRAEVLLYIGCAAAYDPELRDPAMALIRTLQALDVDFGVLETEDCCGDPARFLGDAALFEERAAANAKQFYDAGIRTIVTVSPHCYHSFTRHYGDLTETIAVYHYTEFLSLHLAGRGLIEPAAAPVTVTYHDPCYLGRHSGVYDPPRALIGAIPGVRLVEMDACRQHSLCCGGGGGRMFDAFEEEQRLSEMRIGQALDTGARVLATACPWCYVMLGQAVADLGAEDRITVKDIAQLLLPALAPVPSNP